MVISRRVNVWVFLVGTTMIVACSGKDNCSEQVLQQQQELARLQESLGYSGMLQQALTEKVSDLIAYVEKTWREEGSVEAALTQPGTNIPHLLVQLKEADLAVTFARKRVSEINAILSSLEMGSISSDQIRDRLRRMDEVLMEKEVMFNQMRRIAEDKRDATLVRNSMKESRLDFGRIPLPADGLATELSGLQHDLQSARLAINGQEELIGAYQEKVATQEILQHEMRSVIHAKELALVQSERYKGLLEADIQKLEAQKQRLLSEIDSVFLAVEADKAYLYLQIAEELVQEVEKISRKKNKKEIAKLADSYYKQAAYCACASPELSKNILILREKYLE